MSSPLPTLFVSHGAPDLLLKTAHPLYRFFAALSGLLPEYPRAVVVASAHWMTPEPAFGAAARPATIHDFYGFEDALYDLHYPAPGSLAVASHAQELLGRAGLRAELVPGQGLDHGVWVPLMAAWPKADIPVIPLAVQPALGYRHHLAVGRALAPLTKDNVLILGSGGAVHNLHYWRPGATTVEPWARDFENALSTALEAADTRAVCALLRSDVGRRAHPTDEHILPLLVAFGAAGEAARGEVLLRGFTDGSLGMTAFRFTAPDPT